MGKGDQTCQLQDLVIKVGYGFIMHNLSSKNKLQVFLWPETGSSQHMRLEKKARFQPQAYRALWGHAHSISGSPPSHSSPHFFCRAGHFPGQYCIYHHLELHLAHYYSHFLLSFHFCYGIDATPLVTLPQDFKGLFPSPFSFCLPDQIISPLSRRL